MGEETKSVIRSIRADPQVFDKIKKITTDLELENQGAALSAILSAWEREQAKKMMPGLGTVIEELASHQNAISRIFNFVLEESLQKENTVREDMIAELDSHRRENEKLSKQLAEEQELRWGTEKKLKEAEQTIKQLEEELKKQEELCRDLRAALKVASGVTFKAKGANLAELLKDKDNKGGDADMSEDEIPF